MGIIYLTLPYTHTHTHTQPFYGSVEFVRDNPGEPVPEETFTHSLTLIQLNSILAFKSQLTSPKSEARVVATGGRWCGGVKGRHV